MDRIITIYGTRGKIEGKLGGRIFPFEHNGEQLTAKQGIVVTFYSGERKKDKVEYIPYSDQGSHGGGDPRLVVDFAQAIQTGRSTTLTDSRQSLMSHLIAFDAEKSRKNNGMPVHFDMRDYT